MNTILSNFLLLKLSVSVAYMLSTNNFAKPGIFKSFFTWFTVCWLLWAILGPQDVYSLYALKDEDVIGSIATDAGMWFFFIFAMNRDSGTHLNTFLGIISPQNCSQNVYDSNGSEDRESINSSTTHKKGVVIFRDFAAERDFGTYHMLFVGVKLPENSRVMLS